MFIVLILLIWKIVIGLLIRFWMILVRLMYWLIMSVVLFVV